LIKYLKRIRLYQNNYYLCPMELTDIKETIEGYPVIDLRWRPLDNIIVGRVYCPIMDKVIAVTWRRNGSLTEKFGGNTRKDLYLKINHV